MKTVKKLIFILLKAGMRFVYFFMKIMIPTRHKAVFLSRQSDQPSENFRMIEQELRRADPALICEFYCRLGLKSEMGLSYALLMLRQMAALAGAEVCFTESYCIPVSVLRHKRKLRVIQIWHSMVAIKQFGWQTVDKPEGSPSDIARVMRMHAGYDYVTVGSEAMRPYFAEAMRTPIERILPLGMPTADRLLALGGQADALRERFLMYYPEAKGKQIVVYVPTMRRDYAIDCAGLVEKFDYDAAVLVVKLHPLDRHTVINRPEVIRDRNFTTEEAVALADAVISDYSGAAAEAALLRRPVYFFTPDTERYSGACGLNVNPLEVFPRVAFDNETELLRAVREHRALSDDIEYVRETLCGGCDGHSTERIAALAFADPPEA